MSYFSFLAVPNVEGMRLWWYIQIFGIVVLFGICLFFVIYFLLIYRRKQVLFHQLADFDQQAHGLEKQLIIQKIKKSSGKTKLILFIEYLERFVTSEPYANLSELLRLSWFIAKDIEEIEHVLYTDTPLSVVIEHRIDTYFIS